MTALAADLCPYLFAMCHGLGPEHDKPSTLERFKAYFEIAQELGFESIAYDDLDAWYKGGSLLDKSIMFDFDHAVRNIHNEVMPLMPEFGYVGNLFVYTQPMEAMCSVPIDDSVRYYTLW